MRRYLAKTRKRTGGLVCLRCEGRFIGRDAYDRHLVDYPKTDAYPREDWCHLPEEVGLVVGNGGWWRLAAGPLAIDPGILAGGGIPAYPYRVQSEKRDVEALELAA
jgi:hypothetical protein